MEKKEKIPVYFVGAGPGDPELLTIKGRKVLEKADVIIYAGSLVNEQVLKYARKKAEIYNSARMNLEEIMKVMFEAVAAERMVVRLHSGDPAVYSATGEQILLLEQKGIPYMVIPGVSSAFACAAALGKELTVPGISQTVIFTRLEGRTSVPSKEQLSLLAEHQATMGIFLSAGMIRQVVTELSKGYPVDTPVVVVERVSLPEEKIVQGALGNIVSRVEEAGITRTALILVGYALREEKKIEQVKSKLYDKDFSHGFRNGKK